jgi:hypothetical protein
MVAERQYVRGAENILNDDNANNDNSVCGRFGAFINQVMPVKDVVHLQQFKLMI